MTITINQEVKTSVEKQIPVPSFWKDGNFKIGFLDDNTVCKVSLSDNYAVILNGTPETMKHHYSDLNRYTPSTEKEFFRDYSEAYEAMRLEPKVGLYTSQILNNGHDR